MLISILLTLVVINTLIGVFCLWRLHRMRKELDGIERVIHIMSLRYAGLWGEDYEEEYDN